MTWPAHASKQLRFPELYEQQLTGPLFRPFAELILDEVDLNPGDRVLDIACGTGIAARIAKERLGETGYVVGIDLSPGMLSVARRVEPGVQWREGNATALPVADDEKFDVITCHQGLQFFPDKAAAAAEMRRVLAAGGRLAIATWQSDDKFPFLRAMRDIAESRVGPIDDRRHSFGDVALLEALLRDAGFRDIRSKTISLTVHFDEDATFVRMNNTALVGMSAAAKTMSDDERESAIEAICNESANVVQRYRHGSGISFELGTNLAMARA